jgi:hypothetical protein
MADGEVFFREQRLGLLVTIGHHLTCGSQTVDMPGSEGYEQEVADRQGTGSLAPSAVDFLFAILTRGSGKVGMVIPTVPYTIGGKKPTQRGISRFLLQKLQCGKKAGGVVEHSEWIDTAAELIVDEVFAYIFRKARAKQHHACSGRDGQFVKRQIGSYAKVHIFRQNVFFRAKLANFTQIIVILPHYLHCNGR